MTEHSPLPWSVLYDADGAGGAGILDAAHTVIAEVWRADDADLIVRAVNAHDELLVVAKILVGGQIADGQQEEPPR